MIEKVPTQEDDMSASLHLQSEEAVQELSRPNRMQLLLEFDMQRDTLNREAVVLDYFLPDPYPPSQRHLDDLECVSIGDLRLEKRHTGKVLFAKTIESAIRAAAIQTIVEDEHGQAERLAIYNIDLKIDAEYFLPEDALVAIKEPTLTVSTSDGYTIRVDHPSDLLIMDFHHTRIPRTLMEDRSEFNKTALEWKQEGNNAYSARKYFTANLAYTKGLNACTKDDTEIKYDLLRNRAAANIFLGRFKQGQIDAEAAVIPYVGNVDDKIKALNTKAYERAGHAAYTLGHYDKAYDLYRQSLKLSRDQKETLEALGKVEERQQEQLEGNYEFEKMSKSCNKKRNRLDHASFISSTEIRDAGKHGRGLFSTKAIQAGELIICEKALCIWFNTDPIIRSFSILNSKAKRKATGTKPPLLFSVCSRLAHDIDAAEEYFKLHDGTLTAFRPKEIEEIVAIDAFRTLSVLDHNSIGCPSVRSSSKESQMQLTGDGYPSTGIWSRISYINHACNGNAMRSFIGDMMIIRATRIIAKGEEIFMPYLLPNVDNKIVQDQLQQIWGFKCDCELCDAESSTTTNQYRQRLQSHKRFNQIVNQDLKKLNIDSLDELYRKTRRNYDEQRFERLPHVALLELGWLRCKTHFQNKSWEKLAKSAIALLHDLGYSIEVKGQELEIDRQHCLTQPIGIDAALYATYGYEKQGDSKIGAEFNTFAKSLWTIMFGSMHGFDDKVKGFSG